MTETEKLSEEIERLTKMLVDQGLLIEAGFVVFAAKMIPKDTPEVQTSRVRLAFFAGAQHLWSSVMTFLDPGEEPTEKDMQRMDNIQAELDAIAMKLRAKLAMKKRP